MINVEIKGIGFPNRGAELMLLAIIAQFEKRDINVNFVVMFFRIKQDKKR